MSADLLNPVGLGGSALAKTTQTLSFAPLENDVHRMGEILRGRVLRQLGERQYVMQFQGSERVVDSAIPLRTGDVLYGRVIGAGDQVELERIRIERDDGQSVQQSLSPAQQKSARLAEFSDTGVFRKLQSPLSKAESELIRTVSAKHGEKSLVDMAGMALRNLGIGLSASLLESLLSLLSSKSKQGLFSLSQRELQEHSSQNGHSDAESDETHVDSLIKNWVEDIPERRTYTEHFLGDSTDVLIGSHSGQQVSADSKGGQQDKRDDNSDLARWILNLDAGSRVGHRINTIPLLINGQLIELNVALFDESSHGQEENTYAANPYRAIVLSFGTSAMGQIELRVVANGKNLSIDFAAEREEITERFASYAPSLRADLAHSGWQVVAQNYRCGLSEHEPTSHAVLEHLANLDRYEVVV